MKKNYFTTFVLYAMFAVLSFTSCGSSDDEESNSSNGLNIACKNLKSSINGTWVMEAYYDENRSGNPYIKFGWNNPWPYDNLDNYKYTFTSDGKVTDNKGKTFSYSIYMDENKKPYYTEKKQKDCWPYEKGVIYLKLETEYRPFYAEIKSDGMLYLYNTVDTTGGDGVPKFRYKKQ
jgi:hypothetical protein